MYSKEDIIDYIERLSSEGGDIRKTRHEGSYGDQRISKGDFDAWRNKILTFFRKIKIVPPEIKESIDGLSNTSPKSIDAVQAQMSTLIDLIEDDIIDTVPEYDVSNLFELENIFNKFHKIARQLRTRHNGRPTLSISDEYDVQDLLHALLLLHFDDVRTEEWTPSYAGGCLRMDFLLKDVHTVIEVKKTRDSMTAKDLGEQLIIDIEKYKSHPDCKKLYCFVYDPEGLLGNPSGIINDLEGSHSDFLKVFIKPE